MKRYLLVSCAIGALCISSAVYAKYIIITYSTGTGFFVSQDGYVLTNNHVVPRCESIQVHGAVGKVDAVLVSRDPKHDLALLKTHVHPPEIGKLSTMKQPLSEGDPVVILGYPGQSGRLALRQANILHVRGAAGEERWVEFSDVLQKGNSGGPLLDSSGNVVGVVAAKAKPYKYLDADGDIQDMKGFDIAISLPVIREFLGANHIRYQQADSGLFQTAKYTGQHASKFVVNVRCKSGEGVHP